MGAVVGLFPIVMSALWAILGFVLRKVVFQLIIATCLYWFISQAVPYLVSNLFPSGLTQGLAGTLAGLPGEVWFFLDLARFDFGAPLVITALLTRFILSMVPFIGPK
jgi:hypothetical protein